MVAIENCLKACGFEKVVDENDVDGLFLMPWFFTIFVNIFEYI